MRILFLLFLFPAISQAFTCTANPVDLDVNIPAHINFPPNLPINSLIGEFKGSRTGVVPCTSTNDVTSDSIAITLMGIGGTGRPIGDAWVFASDNPSIGYAFGGEVEGCQGPTWVSSGTWTATVCKKPYSFGQYAYFTPIVRIYKLGPLGQQVVYPKQLVGYVSRRVNNVYHSGPKFSTTQSQVIASACTVSSKNINVPMGDVNKSLFQNIGTTAGTMKDVNISLNCTRTSNVSLSISGNSSDPSKGLLDLTQSQATAKGIAIQILFNGKPFKLNTLNSVGKSPANGPYNIPLKATYYQTGPISPGTANSTATFNVVYQ